MSHSDPLVVVRAVVLRAIVAAAVAEAMAAHEPAGPRLLDRAGLAEALGCSLSSVARLVRDGCPCIRLGDSPRFELGEVVGWLRTRGDAS